MTRSLETFYNDRKFKHKRCNYQGKLEDLNFDGSGGFSKFLILIDDVEPVFDEERLTEAMRNTTGVDFELLWCHW